MTDAQTKFHYTAHSNSFAGISGTATHLERGAGPSGSVRSIGLPDGGMLLDPSGRWALRLHRIPAESAHVLLQVLRDLSPQATQQDSSSIRRIASYDEAAHKDPTLLTQITQGVAALDALAHKLTKRRYVEIEERTMRRTLLSQLGELPLLDRLGLRNPAYSSAAV